MKRPLYGYVIAVAIVWAIILWVVHSMGDADRFRAVAVFFSGFVIGMLAMYIAVHVYQY
jgi:hypothetical protein